MEHASTFDFSVGERTSAIDDILADDMLDLIAGVKADRWWFQRSYVGSKSQLSVTFKTPDPLDNSIPRILSEFDKVTLRATSRASKERLSYVPVPDETYDSEVGEYYAVGAAQGRDHSEDWLGEYSIKLNDFERIMSLLSGFSLKLIEEERDGNPDLRKDGMPFLIYSILQTFNDRSEIPKVVEQLCAEWVGRASVPIEFSSRMKEAAQMKATTSALDTSIFRFVAHERLLQELESNLLEIKAILSAGGNLESEEDLLYATKLVIEASTNMIGFPYFELIYLANLAPACSIGGRS